jgi:hypothetical protein
MARGEEQRSRGGREVMTEVVFCLCSNNHEIFNGTIPPSVFPTFSEGGGHIVSCKEKKKETGLQ